MSHTSPIPGLPPVDPESLDQSLASDNVWLQQLSRTFMGDSLPALRLLPALAAVAKIFLARSMAVAGQARRFCPPSGFAGFIAAT